ncbi:MAG: hypothetical protein ACYC6J_05330 [Coriobacteriia bacterium]
MMDQNHKLVLAVAAGFLGGMLVLGTAIAVPAAIHGVVRMHASFDGGPGYGMKGAPCLDREFDGRGGMGPRGCSPEGDGRGYGPGRGACPNRDAAPSAL